MNSTNTPGQLGLHTWAGLRWHPVTVLGERGQKYHVRLEESVMLPGHRAKRAGDTAWVPKQAVRFPEVAPRPPEPEYEPGDD